MEVKPNYVIAGSFVFGLLLAALIAVLWMAKIDFQGRALTYDILFEGSVTGLRENEQVRYHGLPIGYIKSLAVDQRNPERILVRVKITEPALIREDTIASIEAKGLTGTGYIQIEGGSRESPLLRAKEGERYPIIKSRQSKIEILFSDAPKVLRRIYKLTGTLNRFFDDETRMAFKEVMFETRHSLKALQKSFEDFTLQMHSMKDDFHVVMGKFKDSAGIFNDTAIEFKKMLEGNREAIEGFTHTSLYEFSKLISETHDSVQGITRIVSQLERSPGDFINKNLNSGVPIE